MIKIVKISLNLKIKIKLFLIILYLLSKTNFYHNVNLIMTNSKKNEKSFEAMPKKSEAKINLSKKEKLLEFISKKVGKNVALVKYFFAGKKLRFGNKIAAIYNTIFYCQILGCRKIIEMIYIYI